MNPTGILCVIFLTSTFLLTPACARGREDLLQNARLTNITNERQNKLLSVFSVVQFDQIGCNNSANEGGLCMTEAECRGRGGTPGTSCAQGFGICCVEVKYCGGTIDRNCTYFRNPGYGSTYNAARTCLMTVQKCNSNICQLRLDFEDFEIAGPETTTICEDDNFLLTGGSHGSSKEICGYNTGHHIYYDFSPSSNEVELNMLLGAPPADRKWSIKVSQIACDATWKAPEGCVQYFTDNEAVIKSFNWKTNFADSTHLARQLQVICVRPNEGFCSIEYYPYPADATTNTLGIFYTGTAGPFQVAPMTCTEDYIIIPNASDLAGDRSDRLCGVNVFSLNPDGGDTTSSLPITSVHRPFTLMFRTNAKETTDDADTALVNEDEAAFNGNEGFIMQYKQVSC